MFSAPTQEQHKHNIKQFLDVIFNLTEINQTAKHGTCERRIKLPETVSLQLVNHRNVWVGRGLTDYLVPTSMPQGHLTLDQIA